MAAVGGLDIAHPRQFLMKHSHAVITSRNNHMSKCKKSVINEVKIPFLRKCLKANVLLPSNHKNGIDFDLLLIQQSRRIGAQLKKSAVVLRNAKSMWDSMSPASSRTFTRLKSSMRHRLAKKYVWLELKQACLRSKTLLIRDTVVDTTKVKLEKQKKKNRNNKNRYRNRKAYNNRIANLKLADAAILNKSSFPLDDNAKLLLLKGLTFVPTPRWTGRTEECEWLNLVSHIRRIEWADIFEDDEKTSKPQIPEKLLIPRHSRPNKDTLNEETIAYSELVESKLRNVETTVNEAYKHRNNLPPKLRDSLRSLRAAVRQRKIVVCKSDKDGKIVIVDFTDYDRLIKRELQQFKQLDESTASLNSIVKHTKTTCDAFVVSLHNHGIISETLLFHTIGCKEYSGCLRKVPGPSAKYFSNTQPAYVYPLFKTHKLTPEQLRTCSIDRIPIRLLQSAGNTFCSRYTALLEHILKPISQRYCSCKVNEFCQDSQHYLKELIKWQKCIAQSGSKKSSELYVVAADVVALYPSVGKDLIQRSITDALQGQSDFDDNGRKCLVDFTMYTLDAVVVQYGDALYRQQKGIIAGDNHSVSIANIAMHFIIKSITATLKRAEVFKRYIDDIIWVSSGIKTTSHIRSKLQYAFAREGLNLTFRVLDPRDDNGRVEFLDVDHVHSSSSPCGFVTQDHVKATATDRCFLHGTSHHPRHIYRAVVLGEASRLRRLNEKDDDFKASLLRLAVKCKKSAFPDSIISICIETAKSWKDRFKPPSTTRSTEVVPWATSFPRLLRLTKKEQTLKPEARVVYKKPPTLGNHLLNYRRLAHYSQGVIAKSAPCGRCALCGHYGTHTSMVSTEHKLCIDDRTIALRQSLDCSNFGIYVATCRICNSRYVGQTKNKFSTRWSGHRTVWNTFKTSGDNDNASLGHHFAIHHHDIFMKRPDIAECFTVTFVEQPNVDRLDHCEAKWLKLTGATLNIQKMLLPKIR
uniref:Uncharacterized protein LOC108950347 n=1 Tax=Phallusia mammillata TaxID=59560 RepID=A0A6F9DJC0_9ASCI|nr:uncharacterized protein LOC108950347 [Phallusia mammillata]